MLNQLRRVTILCKMLVAGGFLMVEPASAQYLGLKPRSVEVAEVSYHSRGDAQQSPNFADSGTGLEQLGLEQAWRAQIDIPRSGPKVVATLLWADPLSMVEYAVIDTPAGIVRVSTAEAGRNGEPIGVAEASRIAKLRAERLNGKNAPSEIEVKSIPMVYFVVVTADGRVQAFNSETGERMWAATCGLATTLTQAAAVCTEGVAVIHGRELYLLDWKTGKQTAVKKLRNALSTDVAVANGIAFVGDTRGRIEAYGLNENLVRWTAVHHARTVGAPIVVPTDNSIGYASENGYFHVYVAGDKPTSLFRYEVRGNLVGCFAAAHGAFYIGSTEGTLVKVVREGRNGNLDWEIRTGFTLVAPPVVAQDVVALVSEAGDVIVVKDGQAAEIKWIVRGARMKAPVAIAGRSLFCRSLDGRLVAFDLDTGAMVGASGIIEETDLVHNDVNDRIITLSASGNLRMFRPIGGLLPEFVEVVKPMATDDKAEAGTVTGNTTSGTDTDNADSATAGSSGDVFGGSTESDPFSGGGESDPFSAGGGEDPFSGSSDSPF